MGVLGQQRPGFPEHRDRSRAAGERPAPGRRGTDQRQARRGQLSGACRQARLNWQRRRGLQAQEAASHQELGNRREEADLRALQAELTALDADTSPSWASKRSRLVDRDLAIPASSRRWMARRSIRWRGQTVVASYQGVADHPQTGGPGRHDRQGAGVEADVIRIGDRQAVYFRILGDRTGAIMRGCRPSSPRRRRSITPCSSTRCSTCRTRSTKAAHRHDPGRDHAGRGPEHLNSALAALGTRDKDTARPAVRVLRAGQHVEERASAHRPRQQRAAQVLAGLVEGDRAHHGRCQRGRREENLTQAPLPAAATRGAQLPRGDQDVPVLRQISLAICAGEMVIVGASASGWRPRVAILGCLDR
ncbi:hypothetical protein ACU4GD_22800 [Cupriavidus basilensis]